jgi:hypothetical protein
VSRHADNDHAVLLRSHLHRFLTVLKWLDTNHTKAKKKPRDPSTIKAFCFQVFCEMGANREGREPVLVLIGPFTEIESCIFGGLSPQ